jgi:hypothetical protein
MVANRSSDLAARINRSYGSLSFTPVHHYSQYLWKEGIWHFSVLKISDSPRASARSQRCWSQLRSRQRVGYGRFWHVSLAPLDSVPSSARLVTTVWRRHHRSVLTIRHTRLKRLAPRGATSCFAGFARALTSGTTIAANIVSLPVVVGRDSRSAPMGSETVLAVVAALLVSALVDPTEQLFSLSSRQSLQCSSWRISTEASQQRRRHAGIGGDDNSSRIGGAGQNHVADFAMSTFSACSFHQCFHDRFNDAAPAKSLIAQAIWNYGLRITQSPFAPTGFFRRFLRMPTTAASPQSKLNKRPSMVQLVHSRVQTLSKDLRASALLLSPIVHRDQL